ncbi:WD repeat-containing protein srw1 [Nosema granulosis]|uniref:WD repeat-containing protein srw1 n=1 Tax=Nosema granulosis TaxID=83296 RepID=A0A9P6GZA8_9MICR|nr:WD repeat-containing protein srw1 [Nosema granulosis]
MDGYLQNKSSLPFHPFDISADPFRPVVVTQPYREIKTKSLADDFYSNLIDWHRDKVYIAIEDSVFCHNFLTASTAHIHTFPNSIITCIKGHKESIILGTNSGNLHTLDLNSLKSSRYSFHRSRIGVIHFNGDHILTGSRDKRIKIIDSKNGKIVDTIMHHTQEVCGLGINKTNKYLATGGNDNKLYIYDYRRLDVPLKKCLQHKAAIKAISWSPNSPNLFVTGGGTADKTVKLWDTKMIGSETGPLVKSVDYGSQVCNIRWLSSNLLLSSHGYSKDDVRLCSLFNFKFQKQYLGHKNRVIHFSVSPDQKYFVTGSSDCSIKFWEIKDGESSELKIR